MIRYQEMIAHIPIASHPDPKSVLVVGGGDGGVIREALKHKSVEKVTLVDIDEVSWLSLEQDISLHSGRHPSLQGVPTRNGRMLQRPPSHCFHR
jgi:predicted membrane-bound spermidine synthase